MYKKQFNLNSIIQRDDIIMCRIHMLLLCQTRVSGKIEYSTELNMGRVCTLDVVSFDSIINLLDDSPSVFYDPSNF